MFIHNLLFSDDNRCSESTNDFETGGQDNQLVFTDRRALLRGFQEQESEIQIAGNGFAKNGGKQWSDSVLEKKKPANALEQGKKSDMAFSSGWQRTFLGMRKTICPSISYHVSKATIMFIA